MGSESEVYMYVGTSVMLRRRRGHCGVGPLKFLVPYCVRGESVALVLGRHVQKCHQPGKKTWNSFASSSYGVCDALDEFHHNDRVQHAQTLYACL